MLTYECEGCKQHFEIEEYEALFGHHEHYEHGYCNKCFDIMEQWNSLDNVNAVIINDIK